MRFFKKLNITQEEHAEVAEKLTEHERRLDELNTRLDNLQKRVDVIHLEGDSKEQ